MLNFIVHLSFHPTHNKVTPGMRTSSHAISRSRLGRRHCVYPIFTRCHMHTLCTSKDPTYSHIDVFSSASIFAVFQINSFYNWYFIIKFWVASFWNNYFLYENEREKKVHRILSWAVTLTSRRVCECNIESPIILDKLSDILTFNITTLSVLSNQKGQRINWFKTRERIHPSDLFHMDLF